MLAAATATVVLGDFIFDSGVFLFGSRDLFFNCGGRGFHCNHFD
jgi:hypothetical protein